MTRVIPQDAVDLTSASLAEEREQSSAPGTAEGQLMEASQSAPEGRCLARNVEEVVGSELLMRKI